jgi:hypothetical protein
MVSGASGCSTFYPHRVDDCLRVEADPLRGTRGGHVAHRAKTERTAHGLRPATRADRVLALPRRLHFRDHRLSWRHHRIREIPGSQSAPPHPLPVPNPDILDRPALSRSRGLSSLRELSRYRCRRIDLVVSLVTNTKYERPARAEREQAYSRTDLLDVWTPARPSLLAAPA